ncbi:MAG: UDP-glucose 4-epimerase GalE, partial [bacterium]|nr:UDP-glucose 4-epimerase GalE [bacterium]
GGAGYIGSVVVEQLLAANEEVVVYDNLYAGHRAAVDPRATFIEGDLLDGPLLLQVLKEQNIETVMHFAAHALVGESVTNPQKYFENNVEGSHSLMKRMVEAGVPRLVFSSTCATYGYPESVPMTEALPTNPINPYGLSKLMIEQMLQWYTRAYDFRYVALRYFNACGATKLHGEAHDPETHLIPNVFLAAEGLRDHLTIFGNDYDTPDGTCVRDYIHVEDLSDAHLRAKDYLRDGGASDFINLGTETGNSVLEVMQSVERVTGKEVPHVLSDRRPGDPDRLVASADKARTVLGWEAKKCDIDLIVRDAWDWRQAHPNGYND